MRSRYDVMSDSTIQDTDGQYYPDPLSMPFERFNPRESVLDVVVSLRYIERMEKLMLHLYGSSQYDDFISWYNLIDYLYDLPEDVDLKIPNLQEIENFILKYRP